jgi:hypothetical protein
MADGQTFNLSLLSEDSSRLMTPFSPDIAAVNDAFGDQRADEGSLASVLVRWIRDSQPCAFARHAASAGALTVAIVTSDDLSRGLGFVANKIETTRRRWLRDAYEGASFGLIIIFTAKRLVQASPDAALMALATRFASIFARRAVNQDEVVLAPVFLRHESDASLAYRWECPVNLFAVQGDRRWWHHRRMPGGLALSVNSVGHMMKAQAIAAGLKPQEINRRGVDWALRTIQQSSRSEFGSGVELVAHNDGICRGPDSAVLRLDRFRNDVYAARFDPDVAVPSIFFSPRHAFGQGPVAKQIAFTRDFLRCPDNKSSADWTDRSNREAGAACIVPSDSVLS